ncbi:hypothetical protein BD324DRAFT_494795 [Kockovaella imperatae]|uniref:Uncharacterized protein n=1 Tax=Kockovaella imperatae TaxID=4999 RepID=A0A1Y1UED9_9TREE|nr:hypothetical protein BD324DRAFT_494795 [Kockovaella imperatae]ORX36398.1 hypothetical protein BD324DRAFT_494795 [Kockovaella imperatae]
MSTLTHLIIYFQTNLPSDPPKLLRRHVCNGLSEIRFSRTSERSQSMSCTSASQVKLTQSQILMRIMIALGARSSYHPAIIPGGDVAFPFTLGLSREAPCRALARTVLERFYELNIRKQPTIESIQIAASVYLITRSEPETGRITCSLHP